MELDIPIHIGDRNAFVLFRQTGAMMVCDTGGAIAVLNDAEQRALYLFLTDKFSQVG